MKNLSTPQAILIGLTLIAMTIATHPFIGYLLDPTIDVSVSLADSGMIDDGFSGIASAIKEMRACKD